MGDPAFEVTVIPEPGLLFGEFYNAAFAAPELAVYVIRIGEDGEFTFEDANEFVAKVAGRPLAEIRGRTPHEVLLPEVAECIATNLRTCVETGQAMSYHRTFDFPAGRLSFKTSLMPVVRGSRGAQFVVGLTRDVTDETNLIDNAQHQAAVLGKLGIALPSAVYLFDVGTKAISFINNDLDRAGQELRERAEEAGEDGLDLFVHPDDRKMVKAHWKELAKLRNGEVVTISYRILAPDGEYRRYANRQTAFSRDSRGKVKLVLGISEDMTEHDRIEQEVRDLSARMLTLQIDERRRIAQELHDSTGQHLTAAGLAFSNARSLLEKSRTAERDASLLAVIEDAVNCLGEAQREILVFSYLLHPPHLRSRGLAEALRDFAIGFGRRAGLKMRVDIARGASTIDDDVAVHLFRVCQEALTNVYRHANAHKAHVVLEVDDTIRLTVKDDGIGFDAAMPDRVLGVGLPGMRDRMARLGGAVEIRGDPSGTTLIASLPLGRPPATRAPGARTAA